jgi:hypothetical protein
MQKKKLFLSTIVIGVLIVVASAVWLSSAQPVSAQCGSQASSCKNCHEVQGEDPVNNDGTQWHQAHAFGDFCYLCHGGNNQATDKLAAHVGMVPPLSDIKASCQQCHPTDMEERAGVFAATLGVNLEAGGSSGNPAPAAEAPAVTEAAPAESGPAPAPASSEINYDDPNLVNYVQRYDEIVLGKKPVNWGNVILIALIGLIAVGGGGFVVMRENLLKVSFGEVKQAGDEYPAEVVDMLPSIAGLKSNSRKALKNILANPKADKVLDLMDTVISDEKSEE